MSSFAKLNQSIRSIYFNKLSQSSKIDNLLKQSKEFVLRNCYTIVNINGINFEEFTDRHEFFKPNDLRGIHLMDHCAKSLTEQFKPHILMCYGFSDQYSFVINKTSNFYGHNLTDILSVIVSSFTSNYVFNWSNYFDKKLKSAPAFRGSTLLIPNEENLIKYLLAKHHECYVSNLNHTLYSALIGQYENFVLDENGDLMVNDKNSCKAKVNREEALKLIITEIDSISKINEYLFKEFNINYNNEPELFRKGTFIHCLNGELKTYNIKLNKLLNSLLLNESSSPEFLDQTKIEQSVN